MTEAKKKILLTGATGFVGGHFFRKYNSTYDIQTFSFSNQSVDELDLGDRDIVIHCSALVHQMQGASESEYMRVNCEKTLRLAQKAKQQGVRHFIFLSTAHVFGDSGTLFTDQGYHENSPCHPTDPYGISKLKAEDELRQLQSSDFLVSILRPPMVYGVGAKGNILQLIKLVRLLPVLPLGYTKNKRSLIAVDNLAEFIACVVENKKGGLYLPQDPKPISIDEMTRFIAMALNKKIWLLPMNDLMVRLIHFFAPRIATRLFGTLYLESKEVFNYKSVISTQEAFIKMINNK